METKHTPSPWFAVDYAGSFCIQNGEMYEDKDVLSYDSICGKDFSFPIEVAKANAKLAAAAPELLDACEKALSFLKAIEVRGDCIKSIESAIRKATE